MKETNEFYEPEKDYDLEKKIDLFWESVQNKDPLWREKKEFGQLMMKHINDCTELEKKRIAELEKILCA